MGGNTAKKTALNSTQQSCTAKSSANHRQSVEMSASAKKKQNQQRFAPKVEAKPTSASKSALKSPSKSASRTEAKPTSASKSALKSPSKSASRTEVKPTSASKSASRTEEKPMSASKSALKSPSKSASRTEAKPTSASKSALKSPSKSASRTEAKPTSASKSPSKSALKSEAKTEAKRMCAFPGQPLDMNEPSTHVGSEDTTTSEDTTLFMEDTPLHCEMSTATSKATSAFEKTDNAYQSAGFRKKNKDISAGPEFVGFHLGKRATSPSKIEGPSWLKKAKEKVINVLKSQKKSQIEPVHTLPSCKLTKNIVEEVRAVQQDQTSGVQKSVITNVPISHGFPGVSFGTSGQGATENWSEQFPNAFLQQEAKENMDSKTDLLCRPSFQDTADVADQVDEAQRIHSSNTVKELSKSSGGDFSDNDW